MRANFRGYSSALGRATFHVALIPKYRHKIFGYDRIKAFCDHIFREIAKRYDFKIIEIGFDIDHVHMIIDIGIKLPLNRIVQLLKGISSRKLLIAFPWLKQRFFWGGHVWSGAYFFDSIGDVSFAIIQNYVKKQGTKSKNQLSLSYFMLPTSVGSC